MIEEQRDIQYLEDSKAPSSPRKDRGGIEHKRPPHNKEKPDERNHN